VRAWEGGIERSDARLSQTTTLTPHITTQIFSHFKPILRVLLSQFTQSAVNSYSQEGIENEQVSDVSWKGDSMKGLNRSTGRGSRRARTTALLVSSVAMCCAPRVSWGQVYATDQFGWEGAATLVPTTSKGNMTPGFTVDQTGSFTDPTAWQASTAPYSPPNGLYAPSGPDSGSGVGITGYPAGYEPPDPNVSPGALDGITGNGFDVSNAGGTVAFLGVAGPGTLNLTGLTVNGFVSLSSVGGIPIEPVDTLTGYAPSAQTITGGSLSTPVLWIAVGTSLAPGNGATSLLPDPIADAGSMTISDATISGDITQIFGDGGPGSPGTFDADGAWQATPLELDGSTLNAKTELDIVGNNPAEPNPSGMTTLYASDSMINAGAVVIGTGAGQSVSYPGTTPLYGTGASGTSAQIVLDGSTMNATGTTDNPPSLVVGDTSDGTLNVTDGSTVNSQQAVVGNAAAATGVVIVDDSTWTNESFLSIGSDGVGTVNVQNGGELTSNDVMYIGENSDSNGTVNVASGGVVTTYTTGDDGPNSTVIGTETGSVGLLTIDGDGTKFESTGDMQVGYDGNGSVFVTDGAALVVDGTLFRVGHNEDGVGFVGLSSGSSLTASEATLYIGYGGQGEVDDFDGSSLTVDGIDIGGQSTGNGTLNIDGAGTQASLGDVVVGDQGNGTLTITGGATVNINDLTVGNPDASSNGILNAGISNAPVGNMGFLLIDGASTNVMVMGDAIVGDQGIGTVIVGDNAQLTQLNSLTVGSGETGDGELDIGTGASVMTTGDATVGEEEGSTGAINVDGTGTTLTINGDLTLGDDGDGSLTVSGNSTATNQNATLGDGEDSTATATVTDTGSIWHTYGTMTIGGSGQATVDVVDSGTLQVDGDLTIGENEGSNGALTIDGANSQFTYTGGDITIGSSGTGSMTVQNSAFVDLSGTSITLGDQESGDGTLTVTGGDSTLNTGDLTIGSEGEGTLTVQDAGTLSSGSVTIADMEEGGGTAMVTGPGSSWTMSGLTVGGSGTGELSIANGGSVTVNSTELTIGDEEEGSGTITLGGVGSQLNFTGELQIGENGTGVLAVNAGASFTAKSVVVGDKQGSTGALNVDGIGTFMEIQTDFNVGENGGGTLNVTNGANLLNDGDATLADMTGSSGNATIDTESTWNIDGNLTVANQGIGTMMVKAGSMVTATNVTLGTVNGAGGTLTVMGGNSEEPAKLQYGGTLQVGDGGNGELDVLGGGQVVPTTNGTGVVEIAALSTSTSTISVQGYQTQLKANSLSVGGTTTAAGGAGMLIVSTEAQVAVSSMMHIWPGGTVDVSNGGSVTIGIGAPVLTGTVEVGGGGTLAGGGTVIGDLESDGGTIAPGDLVVTEALAGSMNAPNAPPPPPPDFDVAPMDVDGEFDQSGGNIELQFYGPALPEYSEIQATGDVDISDPIMDLMFEDDYAPKSGDTFYLFVSEDDNINVSNFQLNVEGLQPGAQFQTQINQQTGAFELIAVTNDEPIPEPTGAALVGLGSCAGMLMRRRRASKRGG
jgi:T5SS/PEP-CTERM-associated repeat protein